MGLSNSHFFWQTYQGYLAQFLTPHCRLKRRRSESPPAALTQGSRVLRFVVLNPHRLVGILLDRLHCRKAGRGAILSYPVVNEQSAQGFGSVRLPNLRRHAFIRDALRQPLRTFHDLRAISMTIHERIQAAIPHQGHRNLSCPAWFSSPRGTTIKTKSFGRRIDYGE